MKVCSLCGGDLLTAKESREGIHRECATELWLEKVHKELEDK